MTLPVVSPGPYKRVGIDQLRFVGMWDPASPLGASVVALKHLIGIGSLSFSTADGEIQWVWVGPGWRRTGVASELWRQSEALAVARGWPTLRHSRRRTADGNAWAVALGADPVERVEVDGFDDPEFIHHGL